MYVFTVTFLIKNLQVRLHAHCALCTFRLDVILRLSARMNTNKDLSGYVAHRYVTLSEKAGIFACAKRPNRFVLQSYDQPCTMEFPCFTLYAAVFLRERGFLIVAWLKTLSSSCNDCLFLCYMLGSPQLPGIDVAIHLSIKLFLIIYKKIGKQFNKKYF